MGWNITYPISGIEDFEDEARDDLEDFRSKMELLDHKIIEARGGKSSIKEKLDSKANLNHSHETSETQGLVDNFETLFTFFNYL